MTNREVLKTQVAVIGAGPGGYAAAFQAADRGLDVVLINAEPRPGGVCLLRGCIPSKAFLHATRTLDESREAAEWGVEYAPPKIDIARMRSWKDRLIGGLSDGIKEQCERKGIRLVHARATFENAHTLALTTTAAASPLDVPARVEFEHAVIATGARPALPDPFLLDDPRILTSTTALELPDIPPRLLVIGGGYNGLELASIYAALGSRITMVEALDGLAPGADRDLAEPLHKRLADRFEAIRLGTRVGKLRPSPTGIVATLETDDAKPENETFDRVLVTVGRRPNTNDLNLRATKVRLDEKGYIETDSQMRTAESSIFAVGDATGAPLLAHKATRQGKVAAEVAAGTPVGFDNIAIPSVIYTNPELAWCGLTETEADERGIEVTVARLPWGGSGRAVTLGRAEGLTKLILEPGSERLLGVGIVGAGAGDLISEGVLAVEMAAVARDLADSIHPHPTLSETVGGTAELFFAREPGLLRPDTPQGRGQ